VPSRRAAIQLTDDEVLAFLDEQRTLICATNGRDGWPHLMPLWYVVRDGELWAWTFSKSQKVKNLERDPRATVQVEDGETYDQLRGVMFECDVAIHRELEAVISVGMELATRYGGTGGDPGPPSDEMRAAFEAQAAKRVVLQFQEKSRATWDHRKLAGAY
jgi:PPOX class probable F420-dependent enzyme